MTKKLAKMQDSPWWEDIHAQLKKARAEDGGLAEQLEKRIRVRYLRQIRRWLEEDPILRKEVANAKPAANAKPTILKVLCHPVRPESDDLFEKAVDQVLAELEVQRGADPALYLVNDETGELILPLREEDIFIPPDYVDEGGMVRPGRPIVHPGISAGLAMRAAEAHQLQKVSGLAGNSVRAKAYEHVLKPQKISEMVRKRLEHAGFLVTELPGAKERDVEFGRESLEGSVQSVNPAFHRSSMFASILVQKVISMCGGDREVELGEVRPMKDKKSRWFVVGVKLRSFAG